jgi:rhamnulokinase
LLATELGVGTVPVIAPACHDTGCAVAATPGSGTDWAYISCGTWSLVGAELEAPICTNEAMRANFTNELGVGGSVRFLKNIPGLWLLQECRRVWESQGRARDYGQLSEMAQAAHPLRCLIDPDDPSLSAFGDMPALIRAAAGRFGPAPESDGALVRCILESLAIKHRLVIDELERLTGRTVRVIHMVGGGAREALLCQFTADATGRPVLGGPVEATALGNVLVQALAHGRVGSRADIREMARASYGPTTYEPRASHSWLDAVERLRAPRDGG